jgi:hypothetical protein
MRGPLRRLRRRTLLLWSLTAATALACRQDTTEPRAPAAESAVALAVTVQERNTDRLLAIPGVVGAGVGLTADGQAAVKVFTATPGVPGIPLTLDGVPVQVIVTGVITALPAARAAPDPALLLSPEDRHPRPVPIGVSTGNVGTCNAGTIGARVRAGRKIYALSNNHIYALENQAPIGSTILQPGRYDLNCASGSDALLGTLTRYVPIDFSSGARNVVDAAIAVTTPAELARATPPDGYGVPAAAPIAPAIGQLVQKYGKTSRLTVGRVDVINATVTVAYATGTTRFVNQILVAGRGPFSRAGDSGSLIVTTAGRRPVGLLFAGTASGYTFANPIGEVLKAFNVAIDGT